MHARALTVARGTGEGCARTGLGLVNLEGARWLMPATELRKGVRRSIQLDQVVLTQADHAELTHGNGGALRGITSAFVADHVQLPTPKLTRIRFF